MYYYRLYGMIVASDLEFIQLVPESTAASLPCPDVVLLSGEIPEWVREKAGRLQIKYEFGEQFSWLMNKTTWLVVEQGNKIIYCMNQGGNIQYLQSYILGFGFAMLALQRRNLAIHCSALADDKGAILIAGESGAGKSTVTAALLEQGYRLMADDMVYVETGMDKQVMAKPAFPYQKLCRNVALEKGFDLEQLIYINEDKDKYLVPYQGSFSTEVVPVKVMLTLEIINGEKIEVKEAEGLEKFYLCSGNLFLRHLLLQQKYEPYIGELCLQMAGAIPIYRIGRPDNRETSSEIIARVIELVNQCSR